MQTPPPHKLDAWLPRLANFTQIVLLALTASGQYLSVLPLYQKALLDEAFARKEIELKEVIASLEQKYAKLRQMAVRAFIINAGADCSGFSELMQPKSRPSYAATNAFKINVKKCLLDHETGAPSFQNFALMTVLCYEPR